MAKLLKPGQQDFDTPSIEAQALKQISENQVAIAHLLKQLINQSEIQIRIQCGADSRNLWKQRFMDGDRAAKLEAEAAAGRDVDDVGVRDEEEYDDYPQEYQSLQERTDADREAEPGGGYASEGPLGD